MQVSMIMDKIIKYPRTPHLAGSRLQAGDEDLSQIAFSSLTGQVIAVEEKIDGANSAISFSGGELRLQSRGHYLTGGHRERHYEPLKIWAAANRSMLYDLLGNRYRMYGEWMYAKHKIYYDNLPHYFIEFDILDKESGKFLDTPSRGALLSGSGIVSVPLLYRGSYTSEKKILGLISCSAYITEGHRENLRLTAESLGLDSLEILSETDSSGLAEGLYIKVEEDGYVRERMKYVRHGFVQGRVSDTPWHSRPIIPNMLARGVSLY